jgi:hypothetical protein
MISSVSVGRRRFERFASGFFFGAVLVAFRTPMVRAV